MGFRCGIGFIFGFILKGFINRKREEIGLFVETTTPGDVLNMDLASTRFSKNLSVDDIIKLLSFVLTTTYFSYKGTIYKQKFGAAMGGPISPIIANITMDHLFTKCSETAPAQAKPRLAKKFVDDSFEIC